MPEDDAQTKSEPILGPAVMAAEVYDLRGSIRTLARDIQDLGDKLREHKAGLYGEVERLRQEVLELRTLISDYESKLAARMLDAVNKPPPIFIQPDKSIMLWVLVALAAFQLALVLFK